MTSGKPGCGFTITTTDGRILSTETKLCLQILHPTMASSSYVVVFPALYPPRYVQTLMQNIRRILDVRDEPYKSIQQDSDLILIDSHDPASTASAVNMLSGIRQTVIAWQVDNTFDDIVDTISDTGRRLLLAGDKFLVRVQGTTSGFLPEDAAMAATSSIIESNTAPGVGPGTAKRHDRLLYCYATDKHAYVSIFRDTGMGGFPTGSQGKVVCCVFDALSASSCIECIRNGFDVTILACYRHGQDPHQLAQILGKITPMLFSEQIRMYIYTVSTDESDYIGMAQHAVTLAIKEAKALDIHQISLPVSRALVPGDAYKTLSALVTERGMVPVELMPSGSKVLYDTLREFSMHRNFDKIESILRTPYTEPAAKDTPISRKVVSIKPGPNNVHDIVDALLES